MIRCTKCGTINADTNIFCSKCTSFLEWTGVKVEPTTSEPGSGAPGTGDAPVPSVAAQPEKPVTPHTDEVVPPPAPPVAPAPAQPAGPPPPDTSGRSSPFGDSSPPGPAAPAASPPPTPATPSAAAREAAPPPVARPAEPPPPPRYRFRAAPVANATEPSAVEAPKPVEPQQPAAAKPIASQPPARPPQAPAPDEPRSRRPTYVPPPKPVTEARQSVAMEPAIKPGDLICAVCGAGNTPDRRFCRRCGNSLTAATVAVAAHVPWYRRLFGPRNAEVMVAGERPSSMGRSGRSAGWLLKRVFIVLLVVVLIAPIVGYFTVQGFHDQVNSLLGQGGSNLVLLQHPSSAAVDKDANTFWLADQASGQTTLGVSFGQTTDLAGLIFNAGAPAGDYARYGRPREIQLVFPGETQAVSVLLDDNPQPQTRCLKPHHAARTFDIRIVSSYPPQGASQNFVATREIEFIAGSCP